MIRFFLAFFLLLNLSLKGSVVFAEEKIAEASADISSEEKIKDKRGEKLKRFLESYHSPLAPCSFFIVKTADRYSLDWKLVPAISGLESSFGKRIPHNSYNAYGWANGRYYFKDWQDGIEIVSKTLKESYVDKGARTVEQIGPIYAESPIWSQRVVYFMEEIENFDPPSSLQFTL